MRPREMLEGEVLTGGWTVGKIITKKSATGSNFSVGYLVVDENGRECYLKAMDYHDAMTSLNATEELKFYAELYGFEKRICHACGTFHMSRVVHAIDSGSIIPHPAKPYGRVEYIIFELAEGDVRRHLDSHPLFDEAYMLRVAHNVGVALRQMHHAKMAHQDAKPSNVMMLPDDEGAKLGDLGRAWADMFAGPHEDHVVPGDFGYAPPELLYGDVSSDYRCRRFASDLYQYGNVIAFIFARVQVNALLGKHLAKEHRWGRWGGTFRDVLPYVQTAFGAALAELEPLLPEGSRPDLLAIIRTLCQPDPERRGDPLNHEGHQNKYGLDRYISKLDALSKRAEYLRS